MKNPHFVPAPPPAEEAAKDEQELKRILRESDEKASEIFERHNPSRPTAPEESARVARKSQ